MQVDLNGKQHLMIRPEDSWFTRESEIPLGIGTIIGLAPGKANNLLYLVIQGNPHSELLNSTSDRGNTNFFSLDCQLDFLRFRKTANG